MLLVNGEAFGWCPWEAEGGVGVAGEGQKRLVNGKGQFEVGEAAWGVLGLVWPKPGMFGSSYITEWKLTCDDCRFIDFGAGEGYEAYQSEDETVYSESGN